MKLWLPAVLAASLLSNSAFAADAPPRTINVTGTAEVSALPDEAQVIMGIEAREKSLESAQSQVDQSVARFLKLCDELGIPRKEVSTAGIQVNPEYQWPQNGGKPRLNGYFVSRQLAVNLTDLTKLGQLVTRATSSGVNNVSPPQLRNSKAKALERQAMTQAAADAKARAQALAEGVGVKLGDVRTLGSSQGFQPAYPRAMAMMKSEMAADMAPAQTYETGEVKYSATVNAEFDLIPD